MRSKTYFYLLLFYIFIFYIFISSNLCHYLPFSFKQNFINAYTKDNSWRWRLICSYFSKIFWAYSEACSEPWQMSAMQSLMKIFYSFMRLYIYSKKFYIFDAWLRSEYASDTFASDALKKMLLINFSWYSSLSIEILKSKINITSFDIRISITSVTKIHAL